MTSISSFGRLCYLFALRLNAISGSLLGFNSSNLDGKFIVRILREKDDPFVVDVGCNIGDFVQAVARVAKASRFVCVDIDSGAEPILRERFKENPVTFFNFGVSSSEGFATVVSRRTLDRKARLGSQISISSTSFSTSQKVVPVRTLDSILKDYRGQEIDILKIDTEGGDFHVILGADSVLRSTQVVVFEVMYRTLLCGTVPQEIICHLKELGFHNIYRVTRFFGLQQIEEIQPYEIETQNLVASKTPL